MSAMDEQTMHFHTCTCSDGLSAFTSARKTRWAFCTAGATIVSGGVAERVKSPTYAVYAFCMTSFIYPVVVAWTWGYGWLDSVLDVGCRAAFALGLTLLLFVLVL